MRDGWRVRGEGAIQVLHDFPVLNLRLRMPFDGTTSERSLIMKLRKYQRVLTERAHHLVERRLIELVGRTPTLEIHETPEYLTQLETLEAEAWEFGNVVPSLIELFTTSVRLIARQTTLVEPNRSAAKY